MITATDITQTGYFYKYTCSDRSNFAFYGTYAMKYAASLGIFMGQGSGKQR